MLFFNILIIKNGNIFTYSSFRKLEIGQYVQIKIRNRILCGIVFKEIQADEVNFPFEKVKNIVKATKYFLPKEHLETLIFAKNWHFINFRSAFQFAKPHRKIKTKNNISKHFNNFPIKLSESQNKAFKELKEHQISLLFGDTGTGKTEIYQKLIFENLQKNLDSIILVPEINIIPQLQTRFKKIFGDLVEGWHAKLTKKTRQKVLKNIYLGKTKITLEKLPENNFLKTGIETCKLFIENTEVFKLSYGEQNRVRLAILTLKTKFIKDEKGILFLDEIDANLSGDESMRVAKVLKELSKSYQIFAISHQPQLTSQADHHFLVYKEKRVSKVKKLVTDDERVQEIVRMVGGSDEVSNKKSQLYQFALKLIK